MPDDISRKTVLFWDASAGYSHMAEAVVGDFARVLYYSFWEHAFPLPIDVQAGQGVKGVERVNDFWDALERADLVVFPDVGNGGLQEYLRKQGVPVFGCGAAGRLEMDRWFLKMACKKMGIKYADSYLLQSVDEVRELIDKAKTDFWIKISYWRGLKETHHHLFKKGSLDWLDEVSLGAGAFRDRMQFIIEAPIDGDPCCEVGADPPWVLAGQYPEEMLWGYEAVKDSVYVGTTTTLPARMRDVLDKFSPMFEAYNYRGPFSSETRETEEGSFFLDATCRFPEPPSSLMRFMIRNWGEMMWEVANGRPCEPDYAATIGVQLVLKSPWAADHPLAVEIGRPDRTTLHGHCVIDGQDYAVSPSKLEECGAAVGFADSLEEAMAEALDAAESIKGLQLTYDEGGLKDAIEAIETGNKLGLNWNGLPAGRIAAKVA